MYSSKWKFHPEQLIKVKEDAASNYDFIDNSNELKKKHQSLIYRKSKKPLTNNSKIRGDTKIKNSCQRDVKKSKFHFYFKDYFLIIKHFVDVSFYF